MSDIAALLVAVSSGVAVFLIVFGIVGWRDRALPRCRSCGIDARPLAWHEPRICACGAELDRAGSIRLPHRFRKRAITLGIAVAALASGHGIWTTNVHARGLAWRDEMPTWLFASTLSMDEGRTESCRESNTDCER
ncbi:MAG: hypothetical protein SGJ09_05440 [Phycisphaerae bacterium]|nr:hypothetical protein [Phycisphaerae bacterium]